MPSPINDMITKIDRLPSHRVCGKVEQVVGLLIEASGLQNATSIGDHCTIYTRDKRTVLCEVIGFRNMRALLMPFGSLEGIGPNNQVELTNSMPSIRPTDEWLGRVLNAFGASVDGKGLLPDGQTPIPIRNTPPSAHARQRLGGKIDIGVRSMNAFLTLCQGQRMGVFAGSGVGKSSLMSMIARNTSAEVNVIGLIGERGREAREFIEDDLGEEGMKKSVIIVSTSDEPPLIRRQAAYMTLAIAEYFQHQGKQVLCMMDSVTRFAMAQREIGLSIGEPPTTKGYTPSVFTELPMLLERSGPGVEGQGSITGLFTVLVEGDDHNEPISDAVRGILDGHVVLDRTIAERGRYPAINILRSVSRTMPQCNNAQENAIITRARQLLSTYEEMAELIRLGAYRKGSDAAIDEAIFYYPHMESFLSQSMEETTTLEECYAMLATATDYQETQEETESPPEETPPASSS